MDRAEIERNPLFPVAEKYFRPMLPVEPSEGLFMSTTTYSVPLLKRTQELVRAAPRHISYAEMGRQIDASAKWVSLLANGKLENPGVVTVQRLHDYLTALASGK